MNKVRCVSRVCPPADLPAGLQCDTLTAWEPDDVAYSTTRFVYLRGTISAAMIYRSKLGVTSLADTFVPGCRDFIIPHRHQNPYEYQRLCAWYYVS